MKKKALLSSILTIVLCLSLIAGSTFALFTSETTVDIEVDAGRVNIEAGLTTPVLYSVQPDAAGTEFDENGKTYKYVEQTGTFANGGTATLDASNGVISLVNVTPGDKITFKLTGTNTSDVAVQYRYKIECIEGYDLMSGFVMTVEEVKYASMAEYTSEWNPLVVGENITENNEEGIQLALELPVSAGNEFQELDAKIKISVEAVQNNADVSDTDTTTVKYITTVKDETEFLSKLYSDEILHIFLRNDIVGNSEDGSITIDKDLTNKTIDANGNSVHIKFAKGTDAASGESVPITLENVVIKNLDTKTINIATGVNGDLTITDSTFTSSEKLGSAGYNSGIAGRGSASDSFDLTVENCVFDGQGVVDYAIYFMNIKNLTVRNCEISNTKSWAIQGNGTLGNFVISGCTFDTCKGILKGAINGGAGDGSLSGNFTFANNKMVDCIPKEHTANGTPVYMNISPITGTITFSNNTMNDVVVTVDDMGMLGQ